MKKKPVVGQKIFSVNVGNAARNVPTVITPGFVRTCGTKYFTWSAEDTPEFGIKFRVEDWKQATNYCTDYVLYETEQEWLDLQESNQIASLIRKRFDYMSRHGLTLDQLRQIKAIIAQ